MSIPPPGYQTPQAPPPPPPPPAPQGASLQYEFKSVQALRGRESSTKAKWQDQGWELVSEAQGTLRTELNFRRVKPKTFGAHLLSIAATFRRLPPKTPSVLVASFALLLVTGIIGVVVGTQSGGDGPNPSAGQNPASIASPSEPTSETPEVDASRSSGPADEQVLTADNSEKFGVSSSFGGEGGG